MKKTIFVALSFLIAVPAFGSVIVHQKKRHVFHGIPMNLEMWCGAPSGVERERFPFLAAIHNFRTRSGHLAQTATIYKKGRPIMREYVYQSHRANHLSYEGSGETFSLTFDQNKPDLVSRAELKAYVRDEDGDKFIEDGSISCFKTHRS